MPLSITVHHATAGGYHLKAFLEELQQSMDHPEEWDCPYLRIETEDKAYKKDRYHNDTCLFLIGCLSVKLVDSIGVNIGETIHFIENIPRLFRRNHMADIVNAETALSGRDEISNDNTDQ